MTSDTTEGKATQSVRENSSTQIKCTKWKQQDVMRLIYSTNEDLKQIHRSLPIDLLNDLCEARPIRNMNRCYTS